MKKKVLTIALVVALLAIMVSGSLAYFTAQDRVTNTFTVGSVKIEIFENGNPTDKDSISFGPLTPVVNMDNPSGDESYIGKKVEVKNTGLNAAYVRTHIAIPANLVGYLYLDLNESGWTRQTDSTATVEGVEYVVFTYDYNEEVASQTLTSELLKGVYLGSDVDLEEDAVGSLWFVKKTNGEIVHRSNFLAHQKNSDGTYTSAPVNVLVASQAIQVEGFESGATAALNAGFGANTNPWQ